MAMFRMVALTLLTRDERRPTAIQPLTTRLPTEPRAPCDRCRPPRVFLENSEACVHEVPPRIDSNDSSGMQSWTTLYLSPAGIRRHGLMYHSQVKSYRGESKASTRGSHQSRGIVSMVSVRGYRYNGGRGIGGVRSFANTIGCRVWASRDDQRPLPRSPSLCFATRDNHARYQNILSASPLLTTALAQR